MTALYERTFTGEGRLVEVAMQEAVHAMANLDRLSYTDSAYEAAEGVDALVIMTEWNEFRYLNLERLKGDMRGNIIFDGRNIYDPERMRRVGFDYHSVGRSSVPAEK